MGEYRQLGASGAGGGSAGRQDRPDARGQSLRGCIRACVEPRAAVPADGWSGYPGLE